MSPLTRKALLGEAFVVAGDRGLTAAQMEADVGPNWRRRLRELQDDGWEFTEHPRRYGKGTFRWVLLWAPSKPGETRPEEPLQPPLLDPGAVARPASAITGPDDVLRGGRGHG